MNQPKDNQFNWSQSFGRDRFYTQYKPKVRIYSFFFLILPWFNLFLLAFAYVYFFHALSIVPGEKVELPISTNQQTGLSSGLVITVRPIYSRYFNSSDSQLDKNNLVGKEYLSNIIVFFNDDSFDLSIQNNWLKFEKALSEVSAQNNQKNALVYADKNISLGDAMKLMDILRDAGLENVCFVEEAK